MLGDGEDGGMGEGGKWSQRVWFLNRYDLKYGIDLNRFGLKV